MHEEKRGGQKFDDSGQFCPLRHDARRRGRVRVHAPKQKCTHDRAMPACVETPRVVTSSQWFKMRTGRRYGHWTIDPSHLPVGRARSTSPTYPLGLDAVGVRVKKYANPTNMNSRRTCAYASRRLPTSKIEGERVTAVGCHNVNLDVD